MQMSIKMKGKVDRKDLDRVFRSVTLGIYKDVIMGTPVDTGRARGNWQLAIGSAPTGEVLRLEKGKGSNQRRQAESKTKRPLAGRSVFIANNLGYIGELEEGASKQSKGFVQNALNRAEVRVVALD
jgi:hypothetical protein